MIQNVLGVTKLPFDYAMDYDIRDLPQTGSFQINAVDALADDAVK